MARQGLLTNPKFKLLCGLLKIPRPQVVGLLEVLWHTSYETGNPVFATAALLEAAAEWWGEKGELDTAMVECRMIDISENGARSIHDFWDHAPQSVQRRAEREAERMAKGKSISDLRKDAANKRWERDAKNKEATTNVMQADANGCHLNASDATPYTILPTPINTIPPAVAGPVSVNVDKKPPRKEPEGNHAELIRHHAEGWKKLKGTDYIFQGAKDGSAAKHILSVLGGDIAKAKSVVTNYLADADQFNDKQGYTLSFLAGRINTYTGRKINGNGNGSKPYIPPTPENSRPVLHKFEAPPRKAPIDLIREREEAEAKRQKEASNGQPN